MRHKAHFVFEREYEFDEHVTQRDKETMRSVTTDYKDPRYTKRHFRHTSLSIQVRDYKNTNIHEASVF